MGTEKDNDTEQDSLKKEKDTLNLIILTFYYHSLSPQDGEECYELFIYLSVLLTWPVSFGVKIMREEKRESSKQGTEEENIIGYSSSMIQKLKEGYQERKTRNRRRRKRNERRYRQKTTGTEKLNKRRSRNEKKNKEREDENGRENRRTIRNKRRYRQKKQ